MAILWAESFDYGSVAAWDESLGAPTAAVGRYGTAGYGPTNVNGTTSATLVRWLGANINPIYVAFGWRQGTNIPTTGLFRVQDGASIQVWANFVAPQTINFYRGSGTSNLIGTWTIPFAANDFVYRHWEFRIFINGTTGTIDGKINMGALGTYAASSLNTQATANAYVNRAGIGVYWAAGTSGSGPNFDDVIFSDESGTINNTWNGDARVQARFPNGDDTPSEWTPNSGTTHYDRVNQTAPDGDTTYLASSTTNHRDIWTLENLTMTSGTVKAVMVTANARKDDAGNRTLAPVLNSGGTEHVGGNWSMVDSYKYFTEMFNLDPTDSASWDIAKVNALKLGIKLIA